MTDEEKSALEAEFLKSNGDFLISTFSSLYYMYGGTKTMNILSEEESRTLAAGMRETEEVGVMEVNCAKFNPNQKSIRNCFDNIF